MQVRPGARAEQTSRPRIAGRGDGLLVLVVGAFGALVASQAGRALSTDGWLSLLVGRVIARSGLPSHNTLTVLGHGRRFVDQQWLAQLVLYGLERLGGTPLVVAVHVLLVASAFAAAVLAARIRGADPRSVAVVAVVSILPFFAGASVVRSQSLVYVLFVALVVVLVPDRPLGSRRIALVLLLLVVWANLHGSVLLAAVLVSARGLVELRRPGRRPGALVLLLAPWGCVLASPYAGGLPRYYADTAFNPTFGRYLAQWGPTGLSPVSVPVFVLVLGIVWLLGRTPGRWTPFERILLGIALLAGLLAVRNWPWLALAAIVLVPGALDPFWRPRVPAQRAGGDVAATLVGASLLLLGVVAGASSFGRLQREAYPAPAATRAGTIAQARPRARIFATVRFGDWLLWRRPELAGRLSWDARYELLSSKELERVVLFRFGAVAGPTLAGNAIFVLDPTTDSRAIEAIRGRVRQVFRTRQVYVAVRPD